MAKFDPCGYAGSGFKDIEPAGSPISGIEPRAGRVEGFITGVTRIMPSSNMGTMPADEALQDRAEVLPRSVSLMEKEELAITLRAEKVGYVRGRLKPPPGSTTANYRVAIGRSGNAVGAGVFYKPDTGKFLAGPFRTGDAVLNASSSLNWAAFFMQRVPVKAGQVTDVELDVSAAPADLQWNRKIPTGRVYLADGKTPAVLATITTYSPGDERAWYIAKTDSTGAIRSRPYAYRTDQEIPPEPPGSPAEPVVAAWLPGHSGAAIVPFSALAGETVDNGTILVRAQYQGRGRLDDVLSVLSNAAEADDSACRQPTNGDHFDQLLRRLDVVIHA